MIKTEYFGTSRGDGIVDSYDGSFNVASGWPVNLGNISADPGQWKNRGDVPEPETWALIVVGIAIIGLMYARQKRKESEVA